MENVFKIYSILYGIQECFEILDFELARVSCIKDTEKTA